MKARMFALLSLIAAMTTLVPVSARSVMEAQSQPASPVASYLGEVEESITVPGQPPIADALQDAPLMFIENVGQFDERTRFQMRSANGTMWLTKQALWITLSGESSAGTQGPGRDTPPRLRPPASQSREVVNLKLSFVDFPQVSLPNQFQHAVDGIERRIQLVSSLFQKPVFVQVPLQISHGKRR